MGNAPGFKRCDVVSVGNLIERRSKRIAQILFSLVSSKRLELDDNARILAVQREEHDVIASIAAFSIGFNLIASFEIDDEAKRKTIVEFWTFEPVLLANKRKIFPNYPNLNKKKFDRISLKY